MELTNEMLTKYVDKCLDALEAVLVEGETEVVVKEDPGFTHGLLNGLALGPLWKWLDRKINGSIVITMTEDREVVALTRQDSSGRVLSIMWEKNGEE